MTTLNISEKFLIIIFILCFILLLANGYFLFKEVKKRTGVLKMKSAIIRVVGFKEKDSRGNNFWHADELIFVPIYAHRAIIITILNSSLKPEMSFREIVNEVLYLDRAQLVTCWNSPEDKEFANVKYQYTIQKDNQNIWITGAEVFYNKKINVEKEEIG